MQPFGNFVAGKLFFAYEFANGTQTSYAFWWDLCDYYLELIKPVMRADQAVPENAARKKVALTVLYTCLDHGLRMLHPFMPFLTEELYQRLPGRRPTDTVSRAAYPLGAAHWQNDMVSAQFDAFRQVVEAIRSCKASLGLPTSKPTIALQCGPGADVATLTRLCPEVATLAKCELSVLADGQGAPAGSIMSPVNAHTVLHIVLAGLVDIAKELTKLQKKKGELEDNISKSQKTMAVPAWAEKTPAETQQNMQDAVRAAPSTHQLYSHLFPCAWVA